MRFVVGKLRSGPLQISEWSGSDDTFSKTHDWILGPFSSYKRAETFLAFASGIDLGLTALAKVMKLCNGNLKRFTKHFAVPQHTQVPQIDTATEKPTE
jgi:hypothetical protein